MKQRRLDLVDCVRLYLAQLRPDIDQTRQDDEPTSSLACLARVQIVQVLTRDVAVLKKKWGRGLIVNVAAVEPVQNCDEILCVL